MTGANEWRLKVGDRVAIYGAVEQDDRSNYPFKVRFDGGDGYVWAKSSDLVPLPAAPEPRKPWVVLREAADIMTANGHPRGTHDMRILAVRLEAAAAPKPPTLAEAVRAMIAALDTTLVEREVGEAYVVLKAALARAENGA